VGIDEGSVDCKPLPLLDIDEEESDLLKRVVGDSDNVSHKLHENVSPAFSPIRVNQCQSTSSICLVGSTHPGAFVCLVNALGIPLPVLPIGETGPSCKGEGEASRDM
jgi:hypothetical protein